MKDNRSPGGDSRRNSTPAKVPNNGEIEFIRHIIPQTGKCTGGTADFSFFTVSFFFLCLFFSHGQSIFVCSSGWFFIVIFPKGPPLLEFLNLQLYCYNPNHRQMTHGSRL